MARYRTVRGNIFLWVSILLVCVLLAFSFLVYDYASSVARDRFSEALTSLSRSVMANLDAQVGEMNRLGLTLIYSQVFRAQYAKQLGMPRSPATVSERIAKLESTEALIEIADTVLGPNQSAPQINVFDFRGEMIGAGYYSRLIERDARQEPWYAEVMAKAGDRVILAPHEDPLQEQSSVVVKDKRYLSLLRSFQDPLVSIRGIVEVMQYCDALFGELDSLQSTGVTLFVLDGSGRVLYPYDGPDLGAADKGRLAVLAAGARITTATLPGQREPQFCVTARSRDTDWSLILGEPSAGLSSSLLQYTVRIAVLTLVAMLCSLAASYFIARRVTVPLKALHTEIESLELHNLDEPAQGPQGSSLSEIDSLRIAFRDMRLKFNDSIQEAVALRAHEKHAQLVALQSQLNPHFIHNMLQTVAVMAEEGSLAAIQDLIVNLSRVLRYVSSTEGTTATLRSELECAESYLSAMRARFGDSLEYRIDVPEGILDLEVPRLILQPLLENCFKYATSNRPPWRIAVQGRKTQERWEIEISDNGPGFSPEALSRLTGPDPFGGAPEGGLRPLSISGMGMLNTSERMRLAWGSSAYFRVSNLPGGGAQVVLGAACYG